MLYVYSVVVSVVVCGDYVGYFGCGVCVVLRRQICCGSGIVVFVGHYVCADVIDIVGDVVVGAGVVNITVNCAVGTSCVVIVTCVVAVVCVNVVFTTVDVNVIIVVSDINVVIVVDVAIDRFFEVFIYVDMAFGIRLSHATRTTSSAPLL